MTSRRTAIKQMGAVVIGAPFINLNRVRPFAWSNAEYSARAVKLVRESIVIDMLGLLSLGPDGDKWMQNPDSFTESDLQRIMKVPATWLGKSQVDRLDYESIIELVAERGRSRDRTGRALPGLALPRGGRQRYES